MPDLLKPGATGAYYTVVGYYRDTALTYISSPILAESPVEAATWVLDSYSDVSVIAVFVGDPERTLCNEYALTQEDLDDMQNNREPSGLPLTEPREPIGSKLVSRIDVLDPDTQEPVTVEIRKLETGKMIGFELNGLGDSPIYSPFDKGIEVNIPR